MHVHRPQDGYRWLVSTVGGMLLVVVGSALVIDQLGYALPYRWLFLILLVPASGAIADSVRIARVLGWRSIQPLARLIVGAFFALIGILMSLRLNTGLILPALIVGLGAATIVRAVLGRLS